MMRVYEAETGSRAILGDSTTEVRHSPAYVRWLEDKILRIEEVLHPLVPALGEARAAW